MVSSGIDSKLVRFLCNFTSEYFTNYVTYVGYLKIIASSSDWLYFVVDLSSNIAENITMSYNNGTWMIDNISPIRVELASGVILYKYGKMRVINFQNTPTTITPQGFTLPENTAVGAMSICKYFNGSSDVFGVLSVGANKIRLLDYPPTTEISGQYLMGQVTYLVD